MRFVAPCCIYSNCMRMVSGRLCLFNGMSCPIRYPVNFITGSPSVICVDIMSMTAGRTCISTVPVGW